MMGGANPFSVQLSISAELEQAMAEVSPPRAVKVAIDARRPRLIAEAMAPANCTLAESFQEVLDWLEDARPCLILLRVRDCLAELGEGAEEDPDAPDWLLLSWTPEDAPAKDKMRYACSKKTLRENFEGLRFKEFFGEDRTSFTLEAVLASCGPMSEEEREAVSTRSERYARLVEEERAHQAGGGTSASPSSPPRRIDYGLRAPPVRALPSFEEAVRRLRLREGGAEEAGEGVVVAQLRVVEGAHGGHDGRELSGSVLPDATLNEGAGGCRWLPADSACYALARLDAERLLLLVWRPEGADPADKVLYSASKVAVRLAAEGAAEGRDVVLVEAADEIELGEGLRGVGVGGGAAE